MSVEDSPPAERTPSAPPPATADAAAPAAGRADLLTHRLSGDGEEPVVLLNGGMMTISAWEPVARHLRPGYRLLGCDLRGQLLSPGTPPADLAGHAADVVALLDAVGWESAHLVGASFGGLVAVEVAALWPQRARSLTVVTAMDRVTDELRAGSVAMREILADVRAGGDRGRFYDALVEGVYSPEYLEREAASLAARRERVAQLPAAWFEGIVGLLATLETFDLSLHAQKVRCPALVVNATLDRVMEPERSLALAEALRAEIVEHPTAGHALVAEEPDWLAGVLLDFLGRHKSEGPTR